ncbi:hypothetical protein SCLCIDRAFT_19528 [Scleroderma citrinum Foug A]|uniref:Zn(2)-C6 fungal-type domain-containing protein n=1 Tax=Scleroderma citrinum Foug A TaxID=1036808 RepID=A0A0C3EAJ7_9AGAM|nr:hypothetical protein SCLCIDRAFT_19528 [Scleroderma citrinum Foug A]
MQASRSYVSPSSYAADVVGFSHPCAYQYQPDDPHTTSLHSSQDYSTDSIFKKRKIDRACDACRRRKIKCDGPRTENNVCTNCMQYGKLCSYVEASKPRGPPKAYVTSLEDRLERMEALLKRLRPEENFSDELGPTIVRDSWKNDPDAVLPHDKSLSSPSTLPSNLATPSSGSLKAGPLPLLFNTLSPSRVRTNVRHSAGATDTDLSSEGGSSSESEEVGELSLSRGMKRLTVCGLVPAQERPYVADSQVRFHGKSSWFKLIEPIRKLREEHAYSVTSGPDSSMFSQDNINPAATRRPEFWTTPDWELTYEGSYYHRQSLCRFLAQHFPPPDLADELIILFFDHVNLQFPLFHRPTFDRQWKGGLQIKDPSFGCLCLALFAVASRWCDDPRVLDENQHDVPEEERRDDERKWQRAGWKYFNVALDAHRESRSLFHPPGLFEVQTMSLMGMFIRGTAFHPVAWLFIGVGIRKAQDVGAHRKKVYGDKPSAEEELWKRAFWMLVLYDRIGSAALGRPCCSGEEDFDVDLPLEVDDEYWETEDPQKAFQQPPGKPAKVAAFNSYLRLTKIAAYALRKLYALDRSKLLISMTRPQLQDVLTELNKALLEWINSVPPHLHWSPSMENPLFANQAATLYITYYLVQIIIYRPFLPPSLRSVSNRPPPSKMPVPCIAICVNAARCCSRILQIQVNRGISNIYSLICAAHMCAAILLMNYWDLKWQERNLTHSSAGEDVKSPLAVQMLQLLQEAKGFIRALELVRPRWRNAEIYLHVVFICINYRNADRSCHRNDLGTSMPSTTCGTDSESNKDFVAPFQQSMQFDEQALYQLVPTPYRAPPGCYNAMQEYPTDSPSTVDLYAAQFNPAEPLAFFDMPHMSQFPLPRNLYFFDDQSLEEGELSWSLQNPVQAQRLPQTSEDPQRIVYQRIAQRSYDDFQGSLPPSVPSYPSIGASSFNTTHLEDISTEHEVAPLVYVDHTSVHYAEAAPMPASNYPHDATVAETYVHLYHTLSTAGP